MQEIVDWLNGIIWSNALIFLCLGAGLFFSILTRFVQVRLFREMIRLLFASKESDAGHLLVPGTVGVALRARRHRQHCRRGRGYRIRRTRRRVLDVGGCVPRRVDGVHRIGARPDLQGRRRRPVSRRTGLLHREGDGPEMVRMDIRDNDDHCNRTAASRRAVEQHRQRRRAGIRRRDRRQLPGRQHQRHAS